jgi:hypothetical protein
VEVVDLGRRHWKYHAEVGVGMERLGARRAGGDDEYAEFELTVGWKREEMGGGVGEDGEGGHGEWT